MVAVQRNEHFHELRAYLGLSPFGLTDFRKLVHSLADTRWSEEDQILFAFDEGQAGQLLQRTLGHAVAEGIVKLVQGLDAETELVSNSTLRQMTVLFCHSVELELLAGLLNALALNLAQSDPGVGTGFALTDNWPRYGVGSDCKAACSTISNSAGILPVVP